MNNIYIYRDQIPVINNSFYIVIDVLRAFSTSSVALNNGFSKVFLLNDIDDKNLLLSEFPNAVLAGENKAEQISCFPFDNSPSTFFFNKFNSNILGLKTTNGVRVTSALSKSSNVYAVGANNVLETGLMLHNFFLNDQYDFNIITSHKTAEEDLACALFLQDIIYSGCIPDLLSLSKLTLDIHKSEAAKKFYLNDKHLFSDLLIASSIFNHKPTRVDFNSSILPFLYSL